jgi:alkanesulfonate monooxygenase SsuD/methylene tetrahydromethanopterin reductase-like flavin-dependent oxidoreductase (luciferase family)
MDPQPAVGLILGSHIPPERIRSVARQAEEGGFDELWLAEDYFFTGGVSGAAIALAATERVRVGLGVVSAMARHPAVLAMELATLSRSFPGRVVGGIGLGVPAWMRQMGVLPRSPLTAVRECVTSVKALLAGEALTREGDVYAFRDVQLTHPPEEAVPVHVGGSGPKMLRLSGAVADGSILSVGASLEYVGWARDRIEEGRGEALRTDAHRVTAFALYSVDPDPERARQRMRGPLAFYKAAGGPNALTDAYGISDELADMLSRGGEDLVAATMPERWIRDLAIAGDPAWCADRIRSYHQAGADSVAIFPMPSDETERLVEITAAEVLPLLRKNP